MRRVDVESYRLLRRSFCSAKPSPALGPFPPSTVLVAGAIGGDGDDERTRPTIGKPFAQQRERLVNRLRLLRTRLPPGLHPKMAQDPLRVPPVQQGKLGARRTPLLSCILVASPPLPVHLETCISLVCDVGASRESLALQIQRKSQLSKVSRGMIACRVRRVARRG